MSEEIELNPNEVRKKKQLTLIAILVLVIGTLIVGSLFFLDENVEKQSATAKSEEIKLTPPGGMDDEAGWRSAASQDLATTNERINNLETLLNTKDGEITNLKGELTEVNSRVKEAERVANKISRMPSQPAQPTNTNPPSNLNSSNAFGGNIPNKQGLHGNSILSDPFGTTVDPSTGQIIPLPNNNNNTLQSKPVTIIDFNSDDTKGNNKNAISQNKEKTNETFISPGSFVRVIMVTGVDAPTGGQAQNDPLPVLFETVGKIDMPNNYKLNIKGCRFLGYAWGNLSTSRVSARIESGSCIVNGKGVNINVRGQVFGEDGKPGVRGEVVSKQGQALSAAALSSALEAIGGLYGSTTGTTTMGALGVQRTISGKDVTNSAIGGGVSGGAEKLSEFYLRRAEELFPIVEVHAGRQVEILITKGAIVEGLNLGNTNNSKRRLMDD